MAASWMEKGLGLGMEQEKYRKYPKVSQEGRLVETNEKKRSGVEQAETFPPLPVTLAQPLDLTSEDIPHAQLR